MSVDPAFAALRERLDRRHRETTAAAFALGDEALVRTECVSLDAALGGGFPRGTIGTLEGPPSSGRSALAARLLAAATRRGLGAVVGVDLFPPALETAIERVRWNGPSGHLGELAGFDVRAVVRKHKRAAPVGDALVRCDPFEDRPPLVDVRSTAVVSPELVLTSSKNRRASVV